MERIISEKEAKHLQERKVLTLDPASPIAIKRDVHEYVVETDPQSLVLAFHDTMIDPETKLGMFRIKRPAERIGQPFEVGERFQGCYDLEGGVLKALETQPSQLIKGIEKVFNQKQISKTISWIENQSISNYSQILEINLAPNLEKGEPYQMKYCYLEGTAIGGSTTFILQPIGDHQCRAIQIFEFQEVNFFALTLFQNIGLKLHDKVVHSQVTQAAARIGAKVLSGTIPQEYANL